MIDQRAIQSFFFVIRRVDTYRIIIIVAWWKFGIDSERGEGRKEGRKDIHAILSVILIFSGETRLLIAIRNAHDDQA